MSTARENDLLNDRVMRHPKSVLRLKIDELDGLSDGAIGSALAVCDEHATKPGADVEWTLARNCLLAIETRRWLSQLATPSLAEAVAVHGLAA